jgi:hypothetical protein
MWPNNLWTWHDGALAVLRNSICLSDAVRRTKRHELQQPLQRVYFSCKLLAASYQDVPPDQY